MTTVMEAYDAQMLDYQNDVDVQMHPSHEPWFHDEEAMEDDQLEDTKSQSHTEYEDVEIEMENYAEVLQNPEYEMVDEGADYPVIENHTHEAVSAQLSFTELSSTDTSGLPSTVPTAETTHLETAEATPASQPPKASIVERSLSQNSSTSTNAEELAVVEAADSTPESVEATSEARALDLPAQNIIDSSGEPANLQQEAQLTTPFTGAEDVPQSQAPLDITEGEAQEPTHGVDGDLDEVPSQTAENVDSGSHLDGQPGEAGHEEVSNSTNDPHEISEGVFIEPPPGVLLSLANVDEPDVCIFNQPNHPETSAAAVTAQSHMILLGNRPTLYYEPLSVLFDALRQDEYIANLYDLSQTELLLEAYDLQLVISEDNIFSRETSLHDLHLLHDGSDITGPLRLRLQSVMPRFIVRYRLLQDQILRLNMADEQYEELGHPEGVNEASPSDTQQDFYEDQSTVQQPEIGEAEPSNELTHLEATEHEDQTTHDDEAEAEAVQQPNERQEVPEAVQDNESEAEKHLTQETTEENGVQLEAADEDEEEHDSDTTSYANVEVQSASQEEKVANNFTDDQPNDDEGDGNTEEHSVIDGDAPEHQEDNVLDAKGIDHALPDDVEAEDAHSLAETDGYAVVNEPEQISEDGDSSLQYPDDWEDTFEEDDEFGDPDDDVDEKAPEMIPKALSNTSRSSKRSFDDVDPEVIHEERQSVDGSPGSKRTRVE
ncbi:hypothetical protein VNI00_008409 [Paramarasmius palmivorus]|uniref:Uncharacterized protein n=1 Tax=Paramarasmius palmivorus TaxID=297713 RepID=A0AAW0CYX2_9AGAR